MSSLINLQKPLFDYTDLELKAIAFDLMEQLEVIQKNLSLIRIEMSRRRSSNVLASTTENDLPKMFSEESITSSKSTIDVKPVMNNPQDLITPLRK